ncbi:nephrin-like [Argopecten irradians]|uniref:nephrin-like n=1 Tax=Argopecten irradians TaxID=31199 RepID=UPI003710AA83
MVCKGGGQLPFDAAVHRDPELSASDIRHLHRQPLSPTPHIPDSSFYSSGSVLFVVEAPPVISSNVTKTKGKTGENIEIEVEFYSRPAVSSSNITWTRGPNRVLPSGKFVISLEIRNINTSFHGVDIQVEGYAAVLKINEIAEGDFDIYTVSIENGLGTVNMSIQLINTDPPSPPLYLLQKDVTSSSITVQWIPDPRRDRGDTYIIGHRPADSDVTTYSNAIPDDMEPVMAYTIDGLSGNTLYYITVQSQNSDGSSQPLMISASTTTIDLNYHSVSMLKKLNGVLNANIRVLSFDRYES